MHVNSIYGILNFKINISYLAKIAQNLNIEFKVKGCRMCQVILYANLYGMF
jgi:hypothetical protein